ncbi:hypothetical protein ACH47Z_39435 [Streptomyces sp. NPDC020192]
MSNQETVTPQALAASARTLWIYSLSPRRLMTASLLSIVAMEL